MKDKNQKGLKRLLKLDNKKKFFTFKKNKAKIKIKI